MNRDIKVIKLLQPCCGGKKTNQKPQKHDSLIHFLSWLNWTYDNFNQTQHTHCNCYPHSDRNPISDSSGAFRVEHGLTKCHYFSQAKLSEDALDFTQMTTISIERKHRPGRRLPSHYQIKQFQQSLESHWSLHIAPLCGFLPPVTTQKQTLTLQTWKKKNLPWSGFVPSSPPKLSQTWFVCKSYIITANVHNAAYETYLLTEHALRRWMIVTWDFSSQRACLCRRSRESWGNTEVGAVYSPEVTFPQKCPSRLLSPSGPNIL